MSTLEKDNFDRIPDSIVLLIFNKVHDARSLILSMSVCKRFNSIIQDVDTVSLLLTGPRDENPFPNSSDSDSDSDFDSHDILKPFRSIRNLETKVSIESKSEVSASGLLRWKAEFGSQLQSCVILFAREFSTIDEAQSHLFCCSSDNDSDSSTRIREEDVSMRIVLASACMSRAADFHYVVKHILMDHQTLHNVVIADGEGSLSMNCQQIEELKKSMVSEVVQEEKRNRVAEMDRWRIQMWYVAELKLPVSRCVMKGATLTVVKAIEKGKEEEEDKDWVVEAFDGVAEEETEAVRNLLKKKIIHQDDAIII